MNEGIFLLIFGASFGIPLIIACIIFMKVMSNQMNHLNRLGAYYDGLQREREEKEANERNTHNPMQ